MTKRLPLLFSLGPCLAACLVFSACPSGPSSSAPDRASDSEQASTLERRIEHISGLLSQRFTAARILDDLATALPDRVWLNEVSYDSGSVQIKGSAPSNNLVADYVSRLEGSPNLTEVVLLSSIQKSVRNREFLEFTLRAVAADTQDEEITAHGSPAERLEALEKVILPRGAIADTLRQIQMLAVDSGLQMTKFAPGSEIAGEFSSEWPVSIEVVGSERELRRYLNGLADLPRLWLAKRFSFKAVSNQDFDSGVRASIEARTYFPKKTP